MYPLFADFISSTRDVEHYLCHALSRGKAAFSDRSWTVAINMERKLGKIVELFDQKDDWIWGTGRLKLTVFECDWLHRP